MQLIKSLKQKLRNPIRSGLLYFKYLKNATLSKKETKKTIIVCFDGFTQHGGLVDRLKGIISFYEIAKMIGADFKIMHHSPYELKEFLVPNKYDWSFKEEDAKWGLGNTCFFYSMLEIKKNLLEILKNSSRKRFFVYNNMDYFHLIYKNLSDDERKRKWSESFNELFKPSKYLSHLISTLDIPNDRVAIHTRFTSSLGDFVDTDVPVLSQEEKQKVIHDVISAINSIANGLNHENIYVFSDSITFLDYIKANSAYKVLEGKPLHPDNIKDNNDVSMYAKTFIDFFAIAQSKEIFLVVKPKPIMYPSNYSRYASYLYDRPFKKIDIP
ncbi:hypothetical protein EDM00_00145 [Ornithobacterium rhinotracheale]|uniref:hypothetical protein n=1 Tax=Ornithobacterium rhinotracheale TaxID=28251 RepID=UPI00129D0287|nr:hypothetical protein [Ornithobacterium rhinotracheale]MRI62408.1 hypothetical protein [Ornithobacterium rhinotracheale]